MAVQANVGTGASISLIERMIGGAQNTIAYPGMVDCICITGVSPYGLIGTHITPSEDANDLRATLAMLRNGGGRACTKWFIVGQFAAHHATNGVRWWNSVDKMVRALRGAVGRGAAVVTCDTAVLYAGGGYGFGFNIVANRVFNDVAFGYRRAGHGARNDALQVIPAAFVPR